MWFEATYLGSVYVFETVAPGTPPLGQPPGLTVSPRVGTVHAGVSRPRVGREAPGWGEGRAGVSRPGVGHEPTTTFLASAFPQLRVGSSCAFDTGWLSALRLRGGILG